jgi:hypothetical protein
MHKAFYASGFLYHPPTQQILLHQSDEDGMTLSTFGDKNKSNENAIDTFKRAILKSLALDLPNKNIFEVYDYFHSGYGTHCFVFFANFRKQTLDFELNGVDTVGWFPLKQISKLKLSDKIRQDIIVGQRVISYLERQKQEALQK